MCWLITWLHWASLARVRWIKLYGDIIHANAVSNMHNRYESGQLYGGPFVFFLFKKIFLNQPRCQYNLKAMSCCWDIYFKRNINLCIVFDDVNNYLSSRSSACRASGVLPFFELPRESYEGKLVCTKLTLEHCKAVLPGGWCTENNRAMQEMEMNMKRL